MKKCDVGYNNNRYDITTIEFTPKLMFHLVGIGSILLVLGVTFKENSLELN